MKILAVIYALLPVALVAQQETPDLTGVWQADTPEGPQTIVVRDDSTVSFGEETVRVRVEADTILVQFGEEWVGYNYELNGDSLTLSGGDLLDPVTLSRRVGPASFRRSDTGVTFSSMRPEAIPAEWS